MAVQLQITLPLDWASDFDRVAERWYFFHRPSGFCQYLLPKLGDEITRAGELVPRLPPRPVQSSVTTKIEALSIQDKQNSTVTIVEFQQTQTPAPIVNATQVGQRQVSISQQLQTGPPTSVNPPLQTIPGTLPNAMPLRRASGPVARKPLPRANSAPQQQQQQPSQTPLQQRHDSQTSPRSSISQMTIPENMVHVQQPFVASPRSSISGTSILEFPVQPTQQQVVASSRSSIMSQASVPEVPSQQIQHQPISSPRSSISQNSIAGYPMQQTSLQSTAAQNTSVHNNPQSLNNTVPFPQQQPNPQYKNSVGQSPGAAPTQEWTTQQVESGTTSAPLENPAVFWAEDGGGTLPGLTHSQTWDSSSRPKLANRLSTSAIKMSKKSLEVTKKSYGASKDYVKAHPGRATAIAGGIVGGVGVVADACGVSGLSEAVAVSKVYLNVKRAQQRKRVSQGVPHGTAQEAAPAVAQNVTAVPTTSGPSAKEVAEELFKMMKQQGQMPGMGQNAAPQNNNNQNMNQGTTMNPQVPQQQYYPPQQYAQPQFAPQPLFVQPPVVVQPDLSNTILPSDFTPNQLNLSQPTPDPTIAAFQPSSSPPSPTQCPTPPLSFSDPSSPSFNLAPDPSTLSYDQFLQDQTATSIANQAILNSQAFTTSLTGQDMFIPGSLATMPVGVDGTPNPSVDWTGGATVEDYDSGGDCGDDFDF